MGRAARALLLLLPPRPDEAGGTAGGGIGADGAKSVPVVSGEGKAGEGGSNGSLLNSWAQCAAPPRHPQLLLRPPAPRHQPLPRPTQTPAPLKHPPDSNTRSTPHASRAGAPCRCAALLRHSQLPELLEAATAPAPPAAAAECAARARASAAELAMLAPPPDALFGAGTAAAVACFTFATAWHALREAGGARENVTDELSHAEAGGSCDGGSVARPQTRALVFPESGLEMVSVP
jgi:hypothetical protein